MSHGTAREKWRSRENWRPLRVFQNEARLEIIKVLLEFEELCLSDIARKLEEKGYRMNLPGVVKHVQRLEKAQILRSKSGRVSDEPDARKTIYTLQEKERIKEIMRQLANIRISLESGAIFSEAAKLALSIQSQLSRTTEEELKKLKSSLERCESKEVYKHLSEDEKTNIELWKMMLELKAPAGANDVVSPAATDT